MPALGAAAIDGVVELAVGIEFVDPEHRDLGKFGMARRFRRVRNNRSEAAAVMQEILDFELLVAHDEDVVVEPGSVDRRKPCVVQGLDVDTGDLDTNLRTHAAYLDHHSLSRRQQRNRRRAGLASQTENRDSCHAPNPLMSSAGLGRKS